jgi:nucleolar complex protein 3
VKASTDKVELRHSKKDRVFRTKKERKEYKERKKLEKELAEADAQVSAEEREHLQSDTLKIVFSLYFQILKDPQNDAMLAVVLDGIAKFARLINAEFFGDLLVVLREILEGWDNEDSARADRPDRDRLREELVCLNTAFTLLANQGGSNLDLSFFIERFYHLLPEISLSRALFVKPTPEEKSLMELAVCILDAILLSSHTVPSPARIFMFYKRLLTCILQMDEKEATTFLKVLQRINSRYEKKIEGMWDREGAGLGNLDSTSVRGWELGLSKNHYCTNVRQMSRALWKVDGNVS